MNLKEFVRAATEIHGYKYDYSLVEFKTKKDIIIILYNGVKYTQRVYKHLLGKSPEKVNKRKSTKEFIDEAINIWGYKYDYSLVEYKNSKTNIDIIYNGIIYKQTPYNHLSGHRCEFDNGIRSNEDFINKAISIHKDRYDYSLVKYENMNSLVDIIYNNNIYKVKAYDLIHKKDPIYKNRRRGLNEFIEDFNYMYRGLYNFDDVEYSNSSNKVKINCKLHGYFERSFSMLLKGYGCRKCIFNIKCKEVEKLLNAKKINYVRFYKFDINSPIYDFYIPSIRTVINIKDSSINTDYDILKYEYCEDNTIDYIDIRLSDDILKIFVFI